MDCCSAAKDVRRGRLTRRRTVENMPGCWAAAQRPNKPHRNGRSLLREVLVKTAKTLFALAGALACSVGSAWAADSLTIATVNNGDMVRMQKLTDDFTKSNPDITLNWV